MTNDQEGSRNREASRDAEQFKRSFDLIERTARLGESVIALARGIRLNAVVIPVVKQLVRAATSVGANYCEADEAGSRKEFRYRISLCNREVRETKHWLRMLASAAPEKADEARLLWKEANELNLIFASIHRRTKPKE